MPAEDALQKFQQNVVDQDHQAALSMSGQSESGPNDETSQAFRGWNYYTAALYSLEQGITPSELSPEQLASHGKFKNYSGEQLIAGNPAYVKAFALMEQQRVERERSHQPPIDPFEVEQSLVKPPAE